jgi:hypothetical protein
MSHLDKTEYKNLILNCEETALGLYLNNIPTWWETDTDYAQIHVNGDEKRVIIVLAMISASRNKWSLLFMAKGKAPRVETSQIGEVDRNRRSHSGSG